MGFASIEEFQSIGIAVAVTLTDALGNTSAPITVNAPEPLGPLQPGNIALDAAGTTLSGTGQIGSTVTVIDANGTLRVANDYALDFEKATSHTVKVQVKEDDKTTYTDVGVSPGRGEKPASVMDSPVR